MCNLNLDKNLVEQIQEALHAAFIAANTAEKVEIMAGDGKHFSVTIASEKFRGLGLVAQHKLVLKELQTFLDAGTLHAVKIKTLAL